MALTQKVKLMFDTKKIKKIIPHREPFFFLDEILELEVGKKAVGIKKVQKSEFSLKGHFPSYPVVPGVLIVEALAQVGAVILLSNPLNKGKLPLFAGIDNFRFKKEVRPGDVLNLEVEIVKSKGSFGIGEARALVSDEVAASGRLIFALKNAEDTS